MTLGYNPDTDIPDLTGKVFLVTGGTSGVGKETILQLTKHNPAHIYFTGRSDSAATSIIAAAEPSPPNLTFIPCDQTSLASVSTAAQTFLEKSNNKLDVLICNAGVMAIPTGVSKDGYEIRFAINHLAHALFIKLCLPALLKAAEENGDARMIATTSLAFKSPPAVGIVFKDLKGMLAKYALYGQSKLANVLYASQLTKNYPSITTASIHPGVSASGSQLTRHMGKLDRLFIKVYTTTSGLLKLDEHEMAYNLLWAATSRGKGLVSGEVYEPVGKAVQSTKLSGDEELGRKLWEWTGKELEAYV